MTAREFSRLVRFVSARARPRARSVLIGSLFIVETITIIAAMIFFPLTTLGVSIVVCVGVALAYFVRCVNVAIREWEQEGKP